MQSVSQRVRPPGSGDRRHAAWVVGIAVAAIVVALIKPWGVGIPLAVPAAPADDSQQTDVIASQPPSATPSSDPDLVAFCLEPPGWRVYSTQTWGGRDVRTWTAVQPIASAAGPRDPAIPIIPVMGTVVRTVGWCAPIAGSGRPPATALATVYQVGSGGTGRVTEIHPMRVRPAIESAMGAEYALTLRSRGEPDASWPSGLYIFRVADAEATYVRWFGAEVQVLPRAGG
jgi:hypothetical protein